MSPVAFLKALSKLLSKLKPHSTPIMYMMLDDVTFTVKTTGATGTYNLYSYYEYAKTTNDADLVAIVEALAKYSVSAKAYRTSVIGK